MSGPLSPPKVIGAPAGDLPAYVSNGIVGLRVRAMPLGSGMALLSGYAGEHPERGIEAAACVPYPVAADIAIDGVWLSDVPSAVSGLEQEYDFSNGELTSRFRFEAAGKFVDLEVVTFCSREEPTLACQEIAVRPGQACSLKIRSVIDGHGIDGQAVAHARSIPVEAEDAIEGYVLWQSKGALTTCGIAVVSAIEGAPDAGVEKPNFAGDRMITEYTLEAGARHALFLQQIACLVPSALHQLPDQQAARLAAKARSDGFAKIRAANRSAWRELWKGRILLIGADERWQRLADAAFIYLNCSAHQSSPASTSIFGLATWHDYHYYYGHVCGTSRRLPSHRYPSCNLRRRKRCWITVPCISRARGAMRSCADARDCSFPGKAHRAAARRRRLCRERRLGTRIMFPWMSLSPSHATPT